MMHLILIGLGVAMAYFFLTWCVSVKINNYGLLDAAWSYGVAILAPIYLLNSPGDPLRKWLVAGVGIAWSLRLGTHILVRVLKHHPHEDERYETLRKRWPGKGMFLAFFELQAVIAFIFSLPFLFITFNTETPMGVLDWIGFGIALLALCGEALADHQMSAFKRQAKSRAEICQVGLWNYSRHPNYFFEGLIWIGFFIASLSSPYGWITVACPLLMHYFLLKVTGIPLTEEHSLRSKGEAYREYQRTTSAFIPWFKNGKESK